MSLKAYYVRRGLEDATHFRVPHAERADVVLYIIL